VAAFAERRLAARAISARALPIVLLAGGYAMDSASAGTMLPVFASIVLLFAVCVALHSRLYESRPDASQLTFFYFVMSAGGALGGLFTALVAPLAFDWVWEHPLLVFAAAALLPAVALYDWRGMPGQTPEMSRFAAGILLVMAALLGWWLFDMNQQQGPGIVRFALTTGIVVFGMMLSPWRVHYLAVLSMLMVVQGGWHTV